MDSRKLMLMAGALICAAICAMIARSMFGGAASPQAQAAAPPQPTGPEVLVATRTLAAGTIITPDAFRYQPWPRELVEKAYYLKGAVDPKTLAGAVVRFPVTAGQPLTQGATVQPGDRGFLAAALGPGMRAVTISVSTQSGVAGFVFPGDRIDLLLTQTVSGSDGQSLRAAETIIRNLRVLATDHSTDKAIDENGKTVVSGFSNVTIEATPKISEKIAVAQTLGTLSLALRPIADDRMELERQIAAGEIDMPDGADPKTEKQIMLQIAARPIDTDGTVTTGGEVSRFARRSAPPIMAQTATMPAMPQAGAPAAAPASAAPSAPVSYGPSVTITRGQNTTRVAVPGRI